MTMPWRSAVASLTIVPLLGGCATSTAVLGRPVEVQEAGGNPKNPARGELIAVGKDSMWVAGPAAVRAIPRGAVQEVRVERHGLSKAKALRWVVLGALISGLVLSAACASVEGENECGWIFAPVGLTWGVIGVPSAIALGGSSQLRVEPAKWDSLGAYARFPQGLPDDVDPGSLVPAQEPPRSPPPPER